MLRGADGMPADIVCCTAIFLARATEPHPSQALCGPGVVVFLYARRGRLGAACIEKGARSSFTRLGQRRWIVPRPQGELSFRTAGNDLSLCCARAADGVPCKPMGGAAAQGEW